MPRQPKTLKDHVRHGTFRARLEGHRELLGATEDLPWPVFAKLQQWYRAATRDTERRAIALEFQKTIEKANDDTAAASNGAGPQVPPLAEAMAELGPAGSPEQVIGFFPRFLALEDGRPFVLDPFQERFIREAYQRDRRGRRVYKVILLGVPRGNGKTPLAAGLGAHATCAYEDRPRVFQVAGSREQARIGTDFVQNWIEDGDLGWWLRGRAGKITCPESGGAFTILSSDGRLAHGRKPKAAVVDEWWLMTSAREQQAYVGLATALHKEQDSFLIPISTAGYELDSQLGQTYQAALELPDVEVRDDGCLTVARDRDAGFLMWWYGAPDGADLEDPAVVRACNPGSWVDVEEIMRARLRPDNDDMEWQRLHTNRWLKVRGLWIPHRTWASLRADEEIPDGAPVAVGVDGALNYDTTAVVWSWRNEAGRIVQHARVWSVRDDAPAHEHPPGDRLNNEDTAEAFVVALAQRHTVVAVAIDRRYLATEARHLSDAGLDVVEIEQHSSVMYDATQGYYDDVTAGRVAHDGDPVFAAHVAGTAGTRTERGWRIHKLKSSRPIDAVTAAIMSRWALVNVKPRAKPWATAR